MIEADGNVRVVIGETVRFGFAPGGLHLFDAATDIAITTV